MSNAPLSEAGVLEITPYGQLLTDFRTTATPLELNMADPATGHTPHFAQDDLVRITALAFPEPSQTTAAATVAHKFWAPDGIPMTILCDVWLRVKAVHDEGTHYRYAVTVAHKDGPDCRFFAGAPVLGYGQETDARILLTTASPSAAYIDLHRTGTTPWQQRQSLVRVGRLSDLRAADGAEAGLAIGDTLHDASGPHIVASAEQLRLSRAELTVDDGQAVVLRLASDGSLTVGKPTSNRLAFNATDGSLRLAGDLALTNAERTTALLQRTGALRLGPNVQTTGGTHIAYDPAASTLTVAVPLQLKTPTVSTADVTLRQQETPTIALSVDGSVAFGSDTRQPGSTAFRYQRAENTLTIGSPLTLQAQTTSNRALDFIQDGKTTLRLDASGALLAGTDVDSETGRKLSFDPDSSSLRLVNDTVLRIGSNDDVRLDKDGLQLRLEPGEKNSIKVVGIGRAALVNAYQTADSTQQLDVLAYYSQGVPALHGSLRLGVANAAGGETDTFVRLTRYFTGARNIEFDASYVNVRSDRIQFNGDVSVRGNFDFSGTGGAQRTFRLRNLPISATGLPSGSVWNDRGSLKIVP